MNTFQAALLLEVIGFAMTAFSILLKIAIIRNWATPIKQRIKDRDEAWKNLIASNPQFATNIRQSSWPLTFLMTHYLFGRYKRVLQLFGDMQKYSLKLSLGKDSRQLIRARCSQNMREELRAAHNLERLMCSTIKRDIIRHGLRIEAWVFSTAAKNNAITNIVVMIGTALLFSGLLIELVDSLHR